MRTVVRNVLVGSAAAALASACAAPPAPPTPPDFSYLNRRPPPVATMTTSFWRLGEACARRDAQGRLHRSHALRLAPGQKVAVAIYAADFRPSLKVTDAAGATVLHAAGPAGERPLATAWVAPEAGPGPELQIVISGEPGEAGAYQLAVNLSGDLEAARAAVPVATPPEGFCK